MSNDEYKISLVNTKNNINNNHHSYFDYYPTIHNQYHHHQQPFNNHQQHHQQHQQQQQHHQEYQTVFTALRCDKTSISTLNNLKFKLDDVNNNNYNKSANNNKNSHIEQRVNLQQLETRPMNLITNNNHNTGLDLSHSIRKQFSSYCTNRESIAPPNNGHHYNINSNKTSNSYASSPSLSNSPSIDVENDVDDDDNDSSDRIMSPVSIPSHQQKSTILTDTRSSSQNSLTNMELTAGSMPTGFPLNYQQLYANNAALYGAPVMFSGAIHASYMAGLPLHSALSPNDSYLKAIQAAACGIYSPTALAPPPPPPSAASSLTSSLISHKPSTIHNTSASMMALAPSSVPLGISKSHSPHQQQHHHHQQYSPTIANSRITEVEQQQKHQLQPKKDYLAPPPPPSTVTPPTTATTTTRLSISSNNSAGTYLNDKVNERLTSVDATKDSHFKVPNGKEGSLKHRILRPPSNSDCSTTEAISKIPTMRTYSTNTNFKKGNYIELANGALRRVEDMRTEDFIQCADRSPHHQLAESTVVKVNTSLPSTAVITFSYDRNRSKVDMEVSLDHPFFVYGQGWASCNPEMSLKMFGLKCQRLQVGDICISLTKRDAPVQISQPPAPATTTTSMSTNNNNNDITQNDGALNYQRRPSLTVSSPNVNLKSPSLPTMSNTTTEMPYVPINAHAFSIPVPQPNHHHHQQHHLQQQQQHHLQQQQQFHQQQQQHLQQQQQNQQQNYADMIKFMSSYAYAKGLPQIPHEQLKEVILDQGMLQNLSPKMMNALYQNQIFQFAQQQEHFRQNDLKNAQQRTSLSSSSSSSSSSVSAIYNVTHHNQSPQPTDMENNQNQPPQTQPLDATMSSRKRRWSAPENMFDDDEADTQPPRNGSSPATART